MAVRTGMRFSELIGLEWTDMDFDRREIIIQRANVRGAIGSPKNNRIRRVFMATDLCRTLVALRRPTGLVFTQNGHAVSAAPAWRALRRACTRAEIEPIGWHVLRHTFATQLVQRNASLHAIKELLGHSTIQMTLRYAHVSESLLRDTIALLEKPSVTFGQPMGSKCLSTSDNALSSSAPHDSFSAIQKQNPALVRTGS